MTTPGNMRMDTMELPIGTLSITGFRSLRDLKVGPFGRVNLITGKNNSGKSSLLEAIRIFVTEGSPSTFFEILDYREESSQKGGERESGTTDPLSNAAAFCSLFTGLPRFGESERPFQISNRSSPGEEKTVSVRVGWFLEEENEEGRSRLVPAESGTDVSAVSNRIPLVEVLPSSGRRRIIRPDRLDRLSWRVENPYRYLVPCLMVDPFTSRSTDRLSKLWDAVALTEAEKDVVEALRIIAPEIEAVSVIGTEQLRRSRMAIVRTKKFPQPVPLRSFGDGLNRLFGIVLTLVSARSGVLLIDEVENGLHYSVLPDVWKVIFRTARDLGVQVFATTHSWDCIKAFQAAAQEAPDEGVLVRLTARGEAVHSTLFREDELRIATQELIEVR
ncbi:MAG: ATP/GTP phosphatase [Thermoanaerobaculia bacterium]|nr:ATP/GTP phosphatase [Thermoanaerobaculia bacterium]